MKGSCLCGGVAFEVTGPMRPVVTCHCTQCRKQSGHFWAATAVAEADMVLLQSETLAWYAASETARRGFCTCCGAFLFWQATGSEQISLAPGSLDGPTGLRVDEAWYLEDAGDYYHGASLTPEVVHGSCLCGANRFTLPGPVGEVWGCHCHQCRKTSGHYSASVDVDPAAMVWHARQTRDHVAPKGGVRSFCPTCGSGLTFQGAAEFSVEAGVLDNPTGGRLVRHIFVADKGDYYDLTDGLPQDM